MSYSFDNALRLLNSDESLEVLLQPFLVNNDDGEQCCDFARITPKDHKGPAMVGVWFPTPQLMTCNIQQIHLRYAWIHQLAFLLQRHLRLAWFCYDWPGCGWLIVTPDGHANDAQYMFDYRKDLSFDSHLAPAWLWEDLKASNFSWGQDAPTAAAASASLGGI